MKFLSPEVALYLYRSTIHPCMECCCHIGAAAASSYLELLDTLLLNPWLIIVMWPASVFSIGIKSFLLVLHLVDYFQNLLNRLTDCIILLSPFLDITRMSMSTVSFLTQLDSGIICL